VPRRLAASGRGTSDPAEEVAIVARSRRELLLRVHSFRLRWAELEDCYSQATLELVMHARAGGVFASRTHLAHVIEQRFLSRIYDRRRALAGRSPMQATLEAALPIGDTVGGPVEPVDPRANPELRAIHREELRRVLAAAESLTPDQRMLLACQVGLQMDRETFCRRFDWSAEKYRKVAQRARARLRSVIELEATAVPDGSATSERDTEPAHEKSPPTHRHVHRGRRRSVEHTTAR
jgi:DNA-directed RNA polymerase specialized sigma24 family protein